VQKGRRDGAMEVFNNLDFISKREILRKEARFIGAAVYYHYVIKLYSWERFFIEQYYDTEEKMITRITIADEQCMEKYLNSISLEDLGSLMT
jgi:hypothetical protein